MWSSGQRSLHVYIDLKLKNRMDRKQESIHQWFCYFPLWSWFETTKHYINQVDLTWLDMNSTLNRWTSSIEKCIAVDFRPLIGLRSMIWYCALCIFNQYNVHSLLGCLRRVLTGNVWVDSRWGTPEGKSTVSSFRWSMCFWSTGRIYSLFSPDWIRPCWGQIQTIIRKLSPYSTVYGQHSKKHLLTNLPWQMGRRVLVWAGLSNFSCSQHTSSLFFTTLTVELITISRLVGQDTGCSSLCWPSSKLSSSLWNEHLHSPLKDSFPEQFTHTSSKWGTEENKLLMSGCLHV